MSFRSGDWKSLRHLRSRPSATENKPAKAGFATVAAILPKARTPQVGLRPANRLA